MGVNILENRLALADAGRRRGPITEGSLSRCTFRRILLHFDVVGATPVVEPAGRAVAAEVHAQRPLQVGLHLPQLQRADAVGAVDQQALLVVRAVSHLQDDEDGPKEEGHTCQQNEEEKGVH